MNESPHIWNERGVFDPDSDHTADTLAAEYEREMQWLSEVIDTRFKLYFGLETGHTSIEELTPPAIDHATAAYAQLLANRQLGFAERVALALCLAVHLRPQLLDVFFTKNKTFDRPFVEFGGWSPNPQSGFLPTGATLLFLLAGSNIARRQEALALLHPGHFLLKYRILELVPLNDKAPEFNGLLRLSPESEAQLIRNEAYRPEFSSQFPARLLKTGQNWEDLILPSHILAQVKEILTWINHGDTLMDGWKMGPKLRPGHRSLFYGPAGTGKTFTAALLGKATGREVYRVDLSMVISKYIGETEKNLAKVFDQAEHRNWILFFDEADALFGRRSQVNDAHDRYANQEVSYLLQRIETFDGVALLASNLRSNLDEAFTRRFESIVQFSMPRAKERLLLWQGGFSAKAQQALHPEVDFHRIAYDYELSGGAIMNVIRYISLKAIENGRSITIADVREGVGREYGKEGRTV